MKWMIAGSGSVIVDVRRLGYSMRYGLKQILVAIAFVAIALALLAPFRGMFPPFYYAQYNSAKNKLDTIDGLQILDSWQHKDIYLEDCGFDIKIDAQDAAITFVDHQDWVGLFGKIDGIRIPMKGHQRLVTREQLKSAGIEINGLTDVLKNLRSVIKFCSIQTEPTFVSNSEYDYRNYLKYVEIRFQ